MKYRKEGIGLGLSERGDYALWQTSEEEIVKAVTGFKNNRLTSTDVSCTASQKQLYS